MSTDTLYEGPAHQATFYLPRAGIARFTGATRDSAVLVGRTAVLLLYDPTLMARVSIVFQPDCALVGANPTYLTDHVADPAYSLDPHGRANLDQASP